MNKPEKVQTIYKSRDSGEEGIPYLVVKEALYKDGSKYVYSSRPNRNSIKFLLVDKTKAIVGLVKELSVPRKTVDGTWVFSNLTAFGGSLDINKNLFATVMKEVKEETGYVVPSKKIIFVDSTPTSNQTDELAYCYVIDVTGLKPQNRELEQGEKNSVVQWLDYDTFLKEADAIALFTLIKWDSFKI